MLIRTIEDLITHIAESFRLDTQTFAPKDKTVIFSLAAQFKKNLALTQKQAELIMRILENVEPSLSFIPNARDLIKNPVFKYSFRTVDTSKTISIVNQNSEKYIAVKFPFDKKLSNTLSNIPKKSSYSKELKSFLFKLDEDTIFNILDHEDIQNYQFSIDQTLRDLYYNIKNIIDNRENYIPVYEYEDTSVIKNANKFLEKYFNDHKTGKLIPDLFLANTLKIIPNKKIIDQINSMNLDYEIVDLLLNKNHATYDKKTTYHNNIIKQYLKFVDQWPVLFIINDDKNSDVTLSEWHTELNNIGIDNTEISVLFRSTDNTRFNDYIKIQHLNNLVDANTKVVFIRNKMPKILYKINFKPKIVLSSSTFYAHYSAQKLIDSHPSVIYMSGTQIA